MCHGAAYCIYQSCVVVVGDFQPPEKKSKPKTGKTQDQHGIIAERKQDGTNKTCDIILSVFNDIVVLKGMPPKRWKETRIKVIFKNGVKIKIGISV